MLTKIKFLFEELQKKHPDVIDDKFVTKVTEAIDGYIEEEIKSKSDSLTESIREELSVSINEDNKSISEADLEKLINTLDVFCENAINEFSEQNSEKINESIKSNVSSELVEKIKEVLDSHGIMTEESTADLTSYEAKLESANNTIANLVDQLNEYQNIEAKNEAIRIVDSVCENMSYDRTLKFYKLIEDYSIDEPEEFRSKVESLAEMFESKDEDDEDDIDPEDDEKGGGKKINKKDIKECDEKGNKGKDDEDDDEDEDEDDDEDESFMKRVRKNVNKNKNKDKE